MRPIVGRRPRIDIANGNCGSKPRPNIDSLRGADVIVLTEAYRAHRHLKAWCERNGYRFFGYGRKQGAEGPNIVHLVKIGHRVKGRTLLKMQAGWVGPFRGGRRAPRRFPVLVVRVRGTVWHVFGIHGAPPANGSGGARIEGPNAVAIREGIAAVHGYRRRCPKARLLVVGDFNLTYDLMRREFAGWPVVRLGKVDHVASRHARRAFLSRRVTRRNSPGGHGFGRVRLTATR